MGLEILQDLKYEAQEKMVAGDEENKVVNVVKWCELLDKRLVGFDGIVGKLKDELSITSEREEAKAKRKESLIQEERFMGTIDEEVNKEETRSRCKKGGF